MSHVIDHSSACTDVSPSNGSLSGQDSSGSSPSAASPSAASPSWLESFVQNFFQEKNIKWMLIIGAAIVFGSSLMLVNKALVLVNQAWPEWWQAVTYLTIIGYTGLIFCTAELSRRRLKLLATGVVLQALTLLLLPVCFFSLTWLSAGTAVQGNLLHTLGGNFQWIQYLGLMLPAIALLWIASRTILDHWLQGRQTTFLISFAILCVAGALPVISSPVMAAAFFVAGWLVFTAGVVKVNRHTFWLAEQHQRPRIFGFLPIAMLGIQFIAVVSIKAAAVLPPQWIGLAIVLVSATILMTTRTVAEVFRQRTGDLVRPLPWPIIVPLLAGLVLAILGQALSMIGYFYLDEASFAVVPTSIVVAVLLGLVARDTRHGGFVWASLFVTLVAYQFSPILFTDLVETVRSATTQAINQPRIPLTLYGLTYLPLLSVLAVVSQRFAKSNRLEFSRPIKHFVTMISIALFAVSLSDLVHWQFISPFLVSSINVVAFVGGAILFRDRRYAWLAVVAFVSACVTAIPALNQMHYTQLPLAWVPTVIAGVALLLNTATFLDRLVNRIPTQADDRISRRPDGSSRCWLQTTGCALAVAAGFHWVISTAMAMDQPLSLPMILQFGFLMAALIRFAIGVSHYVPAAMVWVFAGYAAVRSIAGLNLPADFVVESVTSSLIAISLFSFVVTKVLSRRLEVDSMASLRRLLGFHANGTRPIESAKHVKRFSQCSAAFTLPLFDFSSVALMFLAAAVHIPAVVIAHIGMFHATTPPIVGFGWSTPAVMVWLFTLAWANRNALFGFIAAMLLPLFVSFVLVTQGLVTDMTGILLVWAFVQSAMTIVCHQMSKQNGDQPGITTMVKVGQAWSFALLAISCVSFDLPMRWLAAISVVSLAVSLRRTLLGNDGRRQLCALSILANVNLLLIAAMLGGCSGWVLTGWTGLLSSPAVSAVFLVACLSILFFQKPHRSIVCSESIRWAATLRLTTIPMMACALGAGHFEWLPLLAMMAGFVALIVAEWTKAFQTQSELRVGSACMIGGVAALFLYCQEIITLGFGISQLVMLTMAVVALTVSHLSSRDRRYAILTRPMLVKGHGLPVLVVGLAIVREFSGILTSSTALNALSLMLAAGIYFHQSVVLRRPSLSLVGLVVANAGLFVLWRSLSWNSPELFLIPVGLSILAFTELMKKELPQAARTPLHYIGLLTVLCSPVPQVLGGSWIHIFVLMLISVAVILVAIGLRIRSLVYAGSAFLLADLVAMVIRSTIHNVDLLWICGVVLGIGVIALAAFCENHREKLLARIRMLSAELATWN